MSINLADLPQLAQDTANHHIYGEAGAIAGAFVAQMVGIDRRIGAVAGAAIIGAAKEAWDKATGKGSPSVGDFLATVSGAIGVVAALSL